MNKIRIVGIVVQIGNGWFVLKTDGIPGVRKSKTFVIKYRDNKYRVGGIKMGMTLTVFGILTEKPNVINETHIVFLGNHR